MAKQLASRPFATEAEARAFAEGVAYVNDSAVTVLAIAPAPEGWEVTLLDTDSTD